MEAEEAERWRTVKQLTLTAKEAAIRRRTEQDMLADNERSASVHDNTAGCSSAQSFC